MARCKALGGYGAGSGRGQALGVFSYARYSAITSKTEAAAKTGATRGTRYETQTPFDVSHGVENSDKARRVSGRVGCENQRPRQQARARGISSTPASAL